MSSWNLKARSKNLIHRFVTLALVLSIGYALVRVILAPLDVEIMDQYARTKSDYVLMLVQCILGLLVIRLPGWIEKSREIDIPDEIEIIYFVFLYMAIVLGEVRNFYFLIPHWDNILHAFSGGMLGALGFALVNILNETERLHIELSPFFVAFFAFCFALAAGAVWEIYEFLMDGFLGLNMQKYALEDGTRLVGRMALSDTMEDLIVDGVAALLVSVLGYFSLKRKIRKEALRVAAEEPEMDEL